MYLTQSTELMILQLIIFSLLVGSVSGQGYQGNARVYNFNIGNFACKVISDGYSPDPLTFFYPTIPKKDLMKVEKSNNYPGAVTSNFNALLCQTGDWMVLIDAGTQGLVAPTYTGNLVNNLKNSGVDPTDIREVIICHGHADHYGGLLSEDKQPFFPNAKVWVPKADFEFYTNESNKDASYFEFFNPVFGELTQQGVEVRLYSPGILFEGFEATDASGHSPGHSVIKVSSAAESLYYTGDLLFNEVSVSQPEWIINLDMDKEKSIQTRLNMLKFFTDENALVMGYHFNFPSLGYIEKHGKSYQWVPIQWQF